MLLASGLRCDYHWFFQFVHQQVLNVSLKTKKLKSELIQLLLPCRKFDEMKAALEGMLDPETEEVIVGNIEIRDVFKITKVGTVAGCYVLKYGTVKRSRLSELSVKV